MTLVADYVLQRLREWGIKRVYGYPADGINGLYDAKPDHQPVVAVVGQRKRLSLGTHYQQEVDLEGKKAAKAAVRDPERAGIAAEGVRQKLTEVAGHLPGRHS